MELQKTIKDNTEALHDFLADLKSWEKEMKAADEELLRQSSKEKKDKAMESSEEEEVEGERKQPKSPTTSSGRNPRANKKERATALKEEGNKLYGRGRLEDAVAKYTQGMALDPTNALLPANRAMAYIKLKKFTAAEADCNRCLKLDCNYLKGFLRRATARLGLGKEELARRDYLKVLEMEPHNKEARRGLDELNSPNTAISSEGGAARGTTNTAGTPDTTNRLTHTQEPTAAKDTAPDKHTTLKDGTPARNAAPQTAAPQPTAATAREGTPPGTVSVETTAIKREGSGKKLKIVEVNSATTTTTTAAKVVPNQIFPIDKPPHLRSKKPLKRIPVKDVASREEMKEERVESAVTTAAGGGGDKETKKTEKPAVPLETAVLVSAKATVPTVPRTSHQFSQDWHRLSRTPDVALEYLKMIPPTFFRSVDLETNTLVEVVEVLAGEGVPADRAAQYLTALSVSHGFSISLMFLEAEQKQAFVKLITKCQPVEGQAAKMEELLAAVNAL
ncbi:RNA polymerase II-associated protein 3-like isoform X2 [Eriocheir sinensis]|uniref:RNA polymerase II-associated protein 3-like isoform X2 n=1 Tax=Eriocheir sinensis TaxID=95602 RepID=UPI0021C85F66|nr:RNA polymerase II-associated protein 3-like isoform X2 [Eriocheir sinensis]